MKIFYHVDLDGRACGAILKRRFPKAEPFIYNYWYDEKYLLDKIDKNERVVFADIVPRISLLKKVYEKTSDVTLIDHHETSYDEVLHAGLEYEGTLVRDGIGACALVWKYCYPDHRMPMSIGWIADYDHWIRYDKNKEFTHGLGTFNTYPNSPVWDRVLRDHDLALLMMIRKGQNILDYLIPWHKKILNSYAAEGQLVDDLVEGASYSCLFLNQGGIDSSVFDQCRRPYDVYARGVLDKFGKEWLVSITTDRDDIQLNKIAERLGGGGHRKSAGFKVSSLEDFFQRGDVENQKKISI